MTTFEIRSAVPADCETIAALHIDSMQQTYAAFLPAKYLREAVPNERRTLWTRRFANLDSPRHLIRVAQPPNGTIVGFICLTFEEADVQGTLIDNLHVAATHQRQGLGRRMLVAALSALPGHRMELPVHLLVYSQNTNARRFYDDMGGAVIEEDSRDFDDRRVELLRYGWPQAVLLLSQL